MNTKRKVILDTNALLWQLRLNVNIENELNRLLGAYEIVIPTSVIKELEHVTDRYAKGARKLAERYETIATELAGDESIVHLAESLQAIVVTNDKIILSYYRFPRGGTHNVQRQGKIRYHQRNNRCDISVS